MKQKRSHFRECLGPFVSLKNTLKSWSFPFSVRGRLTQQHIQTTPGTGLNLSCQSVHCSWVLSDKALAICLCIVASGLITLGSISASVCSVSTLGRTDSSGLILTDYQGILLHDSSSLEGGEGKSAKINKTSEGFDLCLFQNKQAATDIASLMNITKFWGKKTLGQKTSNHHLFSETDYKNVTICQVGLAF